MVRRKHSCHNLRLFRNLPGRTEGNLKENLRIIGVPTRSEPGTFRICNKIYHLSLISQFEALKWHTNISRQKEMKVELILPLNHVSYDLLATIWLTGRKEVERQEDIINTGRFVIKRVHCFRLSFTSMLRYRYTRIRQVIKGSQVTLPPPKYWKPKSVGAYVSIMLTNHM
jgi:hypothetical protein